MIDPLLPGIVAVGFGLLWLFASMHKLGEHGIFEATLADYQLLPTSLVRPVARLLAYTEGCLAIAWIVRAQPVYVVGISTALLSLYALAMGINIVRGRTGISCGCSFAATGEDARLSWWLVLRNLGLVAVAFIALVPTTGRHLGAADYMVIVAALLACALLQVAIGQLRKNRVAMMRGSRHG
ncbi:MAG: hypothetical protein KDI19_04710 [Pseudomonadales bacterium]|nr:hypothetical protein [Pseudomonadales bacterium]